MKRDRLFIQEVHWLPRIVVPFINRQNPLPSDDAVLIEFGLAADSTEGER